MQFFPCHKPLRSLRQAGPFDRLRDRLLSLSKDTVPEPPRFLSLSKGTVPEPPRSLSLSKGRGNRIHNDFTGFTVTGTYKKRADSKPALIITFDILTLVFHYQWIYQYLVYITQIETNQIMTGFQMLCLNIK